MLTPPGPVPPLSLWKFLNVYVSPPAVVFVRVRLDVDHEVVVPSASVSLELLLRVLIDVVVVDEGEDAVEYIRLEFDVLFEKTFCVESAEFVYEPSL
ncbi:MAG: hypothetical protein AAGJ97_12195, partial [Planctomycetota bacterium]